MITIEHLQNFIKEQKERLELLKKDYATLKSMRTLSFDLIEQCENYFKKEIDCCELNICGAEDKMWDIKTDAMDMYAEMSAGIKD